jgi:hypothetical protein
MARRLINWGQGQIYLYNLTVLWGVNMVDVSRRLGGTCCLHLHWRCDNSTLKMEAGRSPEASVDFCRQDRKAIGFLRPMQRARMAQGERHEAAEHVCLWQCLIALHGSLEQKNSQQKCYIFCGSFLVIQPWGSSERGDVDAGTGLSPLRGSLAHATHCCENCGSRIISSSANILEHSRKIVIYIIWPLFLCFFFVPFYLSFFC